MHGEGDGGEGVGVGVGKSWMWGTRAWINMGHGCTMEIANMNDMMTWATYVKKFVCLP